MMPVKHIHHKSALAIHITENRRVHGGLVVEQRLKRHISKSRAISVAIATYLYVTQTANEHLSSIVVVPRICT